MRSVDVSVDWCACATSLEGPTGLEERQVRRDRLDAKITISLQCVTEGRRNSARETASGMISTVSRR